MTLAAGGKPVPPDASSEALHERHVAAEHHAHAPAEAAPVETTPTAEEETPGDIASKQ